MNKIALLIIFYFMNVFFVFSSPFKKIDSYPISLDKLNPIFLSRVVEIDNKPFVYNTIVDSNCSVSLYSIDNENFYFLPIPQELKIRQHYECGSSLISNVVYRNDSLYFVFNYYVLNFIKKDNQFVLSNVINLQNYLSNENDNYGRNLFWFDDMLYCYNDMKRHVKLSFFVWFIDLKNYNNSNFIELNEPSDFTLSLMQPKRIASYKENMLITSKLTEYKIYNYNSNFEISDSINKSKPNWEFLGNKIALNPNADPKVNACKILSNSTNYVYLQFVDFINDQIMVCYSYLDSNDIENEERFHFYYDIWSKRNGNWELTYEDLDNNKMYDIDGHKMKLENSYVIYNNKIYNFVVDYKEPDKSRLEVYKLND